eukprot:gb/GECH01014755.1/.p1 GENE.gb/GECH01014755.1/~~gb/GECH01014755.1/.p1  ORF type:complete len:419 (+),score=65.93 gb/GECH01014755.1/:1-1257(+)
MDRFSIFGFICLFPILFLSILLFLTVIHDIGLSSDPNNIIDQFRTGSIAEEFVAVDSSDRNSNAASAAKPKAGSSHKSSHKRSVPQLKDSFFTVPLSSWKYPPWLISLYDNDPISIEAPRNQDYPAYTSCYRLSTNRDQVLTSAIKKNKRESCRWLISIISMFDSLNRRNSIRETWVSSSVLGNHPDVCYTFIIGQPNGNMDAEIMNSVKEEHEKYGDMVFLNHSESYMSLTEKTLHTLLRIYISAIENDEDNSSPYNFEYVIKTDDDAYIDIRGMKTWVEHQVHNAHKDPRLQCVYAGRMDTTHKPLHKIKSKFSIWEWEWPFSKFKPFARGAGYVLSRRCLEYLHSLCFLQDNGGSSLPYLRLEDVNIGATLDGYPGLFRLSSSKITWLPECKGKILCHHLSPSQMNRVHINKNKK